jgi:hypothetical protein
VPVSTDTQHTTLSALREYLRAVTGELGIGLESCTVDQDSPVSAYVALDTRHPHYPDRDLALLWDERRGWAAAIETRSGEDLIVLRYLADDTVAPPPHRVARFVVALHDDDHTIGQLQSPQPRTPGDHGELATLLRDATPSGRTSAVSRSASGVSSR